MCNELEEVHNEERSKMSLYENFILLDEEKAKSRRIAVVSPLIGWRLKIYSAC
jgi:hypothetical protein